MARGGTYMVVGATGMLGRQLMACGRELGVEMIGCARSGSDVALDISSDAEGVEREVRRIRPDVVVNSAAIVDLKLCERDPGLAYAVNARGVSWLAQASRAAGAAFVQVSTDHYYSGDGDTRHGEEHPVTLLNEYARSKFAGEAFALGAGSALVVRTNITGFRGGDGPPTFMEWVLGELRAGQPMSLFDDYFTSTIDVRNFAAALFELVDKGAHGIFNLASTSVASKLAFVTEVARQSGLSLDGAVAASVRELSPPRAESAGLDVGKAEKVLGYRLPDLEEVVKSLIEEEARDR